MENWKFVGRSGGGGGERGKKRKEIREETAKQSGKLKI